jgi:hypothetical protein
METITRNEILALFLNPEQSGINGNSFIGLDTLTEVKLLGGKKNEFVGNTQKATTNINVMVFSNKNSNGYENMVNRRLIAEGKSPDDFVLSPRTWGVRIPNTPIIEHKGEYYLEVIFLKSPNLHTSYFFNGKPIEKRFIQGFPEKSEEGEQGGLDNKVIIRTYKIASLSRISINKKVYVVVD